MPLMLRRFYMKNFFEGNEYNFKIIDKEINKNECSWTLKSICKQTNVYSVINNLNPILSELGIGEDTICGRFEDSSLWKISKREMEKFNKITKTFLTNKNYLKYLENKLDGDRCQGEWENVEE